MHARGGLDGGEEIRPQAHGLEDLGHDPDRALRLGRRVELGQRPFGLRRLHHLDSRHRLILSNAAPTVAVTLARSSMGLTIAAEPFDSDDAQRLIAGLDAGLAAIYPP